MQTPALKKPMAGFDPTTSRLLSGCSTAKLHWLVVLSVAKIAVAFFAHKLVKKTEMGFEPNDFVGENDRSGIRTHALSD